MLERWFRQSMIESRKFTRIGSWWDRKGENEIDAIAENELDDTAIFYEIKRNKANISLPKLQEKAACFLRATGQFNGYKLSCLGFQWRKCKFFPFPGLLPAEDLHYNNDSGSWTGIRVARINL